MGHLKDSIYYAEAIHVIERSFGNFYLFDTFIISEINEGVIFTWEGHAKQLAEEFSSLYEHQGDKMVYISNRVHSYSVKPSDWLKFSKNNYSFKAYGVVSYNKHSFLTSLIEKLFFRNDFVRFDNIDEAVEWAKSLTNKTKN